MYLTCKYAPLCTQTHMCTTKYIYTCIKMYRQIYKPFKNGTKSAKINPEHLTKYISLLN